MFNLTPQERQAVIFLVSVALIGLGISFLAKRSVTIKNIACLNEHLGKINLNRADQESLMIVPGIGKKLAERIIAYRNQNSTFSSVEELKNIKGFRGYRFEKIKGLIYVEQ
jgi:competence ComEA-like helix-hairpin-helix protein